MSNLEKLPPQALDMERSVLGAMLFDREAAGVAAELLHPADFYKGAHRIIFEAAVRLLDARQALDHALLCDALAEAGRLDECGGRVGISELLDACPTSAHIEEYCAIVKDRALTRRIIAAATDLVREGFEPGVKAGELLERAEQALLALAGARNSRTVRAGDVVAALLADLDQHGLVSPDSLDTGFPDLDELTDGFHPGELIILAGRPSTGKTSLALSVLARTALAPDAPPAALFSLEMTGAQVVQNLSCSLARVDGHQVRRATATLAELERLRGAYARVKTAPIWIDDDTDVSLTALRARARRLVAKEGVKLVIVDYLQLVAGPREAARESRQQEVAAVSRGLKALARELSVPVVALCQLNRLMETRASHRPQLSDLRESGAMEQDADAVILLHRPGLYAEPPDRLAPVTAIVAKNRNGPVADVLLSFIDSQFRFENYVPGGLSDELS